MSENESDILISPIGELRFVETCDFDALDETLAFGRAINPRDDVQKRAFAGTGRTHQREKFALGNVERDIVQRGDIDIALPVNLREIPHRHDRFFVGPAV